MVSHQPPDEILNRDLEHISTARRETLLKFAPVKYMAWWSGGFSGRGAVVALSNRRCG